MKNFSSPQCNLQHGPTQNQTLDPPMLLEHTQLYMRIFTSTHLLTFFLQAKSNEVANQHQHLYLYCQKAPPTNVLKTVILLVVSQIFGKKSLLKWEQC